MHSHTQCHVHGILFPVMKPHIISDLRSPRGSHWFLTGVSCVVLNTKVLDMPRGISVQSFKFLAALEVSNLLAISRASFKESKRTSLVPDWSQTLRNVFDLHIGNFVQIFKS